MELTIREHDLRRLQGAIEAIVGAESRIRHGLAGERPRLCHLGLDTIRAALVVMADAIRLARPADLRPELSEAYLAQVVDDLCYVEAVATERVETAAERHVARARGHLNAAILALRQRIGVAR
jgi:hypothetical protein